MLSRRSKISLLVIILLQASFFAYWFFAESTKLSDPKARTILVRALPLNQRDLISGHYLNLRYRFSNMWHFKEQDEVIYSKPGQEVYVVLKKKSNWFEPDYIAFTKPMIREDQVVLKGNLFSDYGKIEYGIEKFFINANWENINPAPDKIEVLLIIDEDLKPKIKALLVNGKEFKK